MPEPTILFALALSSLANHAPHWLQDLKDLTLQKGKEHAIGQAKQYVENRKQIDHMRTALEQAAQQGLLAFDSQAERDAYRTVISYLLQEGPNLKSLTHEAFNLLTLSDTPDLNALAEKYHLRARVAAWAQNTHYEELDILPYLEQFFKQLRNALLQDMLFQSSFQNVLLFHATMDIRQSQEETASALSIIKNTVTSTYTDQQFKHDIHRYLTHLEETLHYLKIVAIVPRDQKQDPDLKEIFVPLRMTLQNPRELVDEQESKTSIIPVLKQHPYLVVLGGPGSGKSTMMRHLAWTHAAAEINETLLSSTTVLPDHPIPLRIILSRFCESRRQTPSLTFLSYVVNLLHRAGMEDIQTRLFQRLLLEKRIILLFDGLDEVATLDERKQLVEEIESFVLCHPGNRFIITSRPVGYDLTRLSTTLFQHANIQPFNPRQIKQFLERWYTHVLRLSPLPQEDRQELETLLDIIKENTRLYKLAENPLLLTVITALHRYERLPDKRVQVYEKCANILLETWAKLRGTNDRWKDIQMSKENQTACVAYLGFALHQRSQEEANQQANQRQNVGATSDVSSRLLLNYIKQFFKDRDLLVEITAPNKEAERFLELMQVETGLIVERGTNEHGEMLYGFVHRTFQEYFAAADLYERFLQEVDQPLNIIAQFLQLHLHDPHWHEVTLLLLGKLRPKPVTRLLSQILDGIICSQRSQYTAILQNDLFFVSTCISEEIAVENTLVNEIINRLVHIARTSPLETQQIHAIDHIAELIHKRAYAPLVEETLNNIFFEDTIQISTRVTAARNIYTKKSMKNRNSKYSINILLRLAALTNLSVEHRIAAARAISSIPMSDITDLIVGEREQAFHILLGFAQQPDLPLEQRIIAARAVFSSTMKRIPNLIALYRQAVHILLGFAQQPDLPLEQRIAAARAIFLNSGRDITDLIVGERKQAVHILLGFAQQPDLPLEQRIAAAQVIFLNSRRDITDLIVEEREQAVHILFDLAQQPDLPPEQRIAAARAIIIRSVRYGPNLIASYRQVVHILFDLAQQPDLPLEQQIAAAQAILLNSGINREDMITKACEQAVHILLGFAQQPDLPLEQRIIAARAVSFHRPRMPLQPQQQAIIMLQEVMENKNNPREHRLQAAERFIAASSHEGIVNVIDKRRIQATVIVLDLLQKDEITQYFQKYWDPSSQYYVEGISSEDAPLLISLIQNTLLPPNVRNVFYQAAVEIIPQLNRLLSIPQK